MRAVVLRQINQPAAVEELTPRPVGRHEVVVQVAASGICHTDLSVRGGGMPVPRGTTATNDSNSSSPAIVHWSREPLAAC
jgi:D-arabinose 1-dehydrogenase-like Zn-dependent alcohol dehydrogenase